MITADTKELEEYLEEYKKQFILQAEEAVRTFAAKSISSLVRITPYGDSTRFFDYYKDRPAPYPKAEGMLRANWDISLNGSSEQMDYVSGSRQGEKSVFDAYRIMQGYKLGDKFAFYNITDYIPLINSQQAPEGVYVKAEKALTDLYKHSNLNEYMKAAK